MRKFFTLQMVAYVALLAFPWYASAQAPLDAPQNQTLSADANWAMVGANPQRTSWTPEEVRGNLSPQWYKQFDPYIPPKVQIIADNGLLFVATAAGLYALNAENGSEAWVYPTELPLGNSPSIADGVAYVGGFDHKLHAINASTGQGLWTFEANAGFETNPLIVNGKVFLGNRDGYFYAIYAQGQPQAGQLAWKFKTDGAILYSAAYNDGVIFFASEDSYAYAINAETGALVWKSDKLPGAGFRSWWPVIYQNRVIFSGSNNYRTGITPGNNTFFTTRELNELYPNHVNEDRGTPIGVLGQESGDWAAGTTTIDMSRSSGTTIPVTEYFEEKPYRRTYFVLDAANGREITYDFDHDGKPEYAPILWVGTHSGNRYPPAIGNDGVLYQSNNFYSDKWIAGGNISGWKIDTPFISVPNEGWNAVDEPQAYTIGGNVIYWNRCCDRLAQGFDINDLGTSWNYFVYDLATSILPGYNTRYYNPDSDFTSPFASFDGENGIYGFHGDTNPPIPYNGKLYMHRSNAVIAFADTNANPVVLPMAQKVTPPSANITLRTTDALIADLEARVQEIIDAGHLRPAYISHGIFDLRSRFICGDNLTDYWSNSSDTLYTLTKAFPYLSPELQLSVKTYLDNELANYAPYTVNHVGWNSGAPREPFIIPDDIQLSNYGPQSENYTFKNNSGWGRNPYMFYALWEYAKTFNNATTLFDAAKNKLETPPDDAALIKNPGIHNAFIAGYDGYLKLEALAGYSESASVRSTLNHLLELRAANFTKDSAYSNFGWGSNETYCRTMNVANNFMYLTPELASYLQTHAIGAVQGAMTEYESVAPYWFVAIPSIGFGENAISTLYDSYALFMAKALIFEEPGIVLQQYLDVPAFAQGDLFYIQKLITILENDLGTPQSANFILNVSPTTQMTTAGGSAQYTISLTPIGGFDEIVSLSLESVLASISANFNQNSISTSESAILTITDLQGSGSQTLSIIATGDEITHQQNIVFTVATQQVFLPLILKGQ